MADFLDSNILIYTFDKREIRKAQIAEAIVDRCILDRSGVISYQVVQETLNVLLRGYRVPVTESDANEILQETLLPLWLIKPSLALYERALEIHERYRFSFYDSLIVAAAIEGRCERILSEDMQHGQIIEGVRIENPFLD